MNEPVSTNRVLVVEDDSSIAFVLREGFEYEGWRVTIAQDGPSGLRLAADTHPDVVILDLMLPGLSGFDLCTQLRRNGDPVPIIMLTARGQEHDRVHGLRIGADDYVTKPFSFVELLARVEAVVRRARNQVVPDAPYRFGGVTVSFRDMTATRNGRPLNLTAREFSLLQYFVENRARVVTRDQLLDSVWGYGRFPMSRTVDMHIAKLRRKIEENPDNPKWLVTIHGAGYKFLG